MSEKQPQIIIFNAEGELVAIARSIRSAAELTKVDENDVARNDKIYPSNIVSDTMLSRQLHIIHSVN